MWVLWMAWKISQKETHVVWCNLLQSISFCTKTFLVLSCQCTCFSSKYTEGFGPLIRRNSKVSGLKGSQLHRHTAGVETQVLWPDFKVQNIFTMKESEWKLHFFFYFFSKTENISNITFSIFFFSCQNQHQPGLLTHLFFDAVHLLTSTHSLETIE